MKKPKPTTVRNRRIVTDDYLISVATTGSSPALALQAEGELRRRYPSRKAANLIAAAHRDANKGKPR